MWWLDVLLADGDSIQGKWDACVILKKNFIISKMGNLPYGFIVYLDVIEKAIIKQGICYLSNYLPSTMCSYEKKKKLTFYVT